MEKTSYIW